MYMDIALLSKVELAPPGVSSVAFFVLFGRGDASTVYCQQTTHSQRYPAEEGSVHGFTRVQGSQGLPVSWTLH